MDWEKLQNGSDIRGVALDGVEGEKINLTADVVKVIGKSFVKWLEQKGTNEKISVAVGTDSRISGPKLKSAFIKGVSEMGVDVFDCNMASTPAMFMTTVNQDKRVTGGVMITASHLPFNRNGLKFFTKEGGLNKGDIKAILKIAEAGNINDAKQAGKVESWDFINTYSDFLVDYIRKGANNSENYNGPLKGLKIIVDAGNGAGGFFASKVLAKLGAQTKGSQFLESDGNFPNHVPNPEDKDAMESICKAVRNSQADLGIIFDTDVDRSAIVDRNGNPVNRNSLIALISAVILKEHPGSTIVTDSITSEGLTKFIQEDLKGKHHRFKRGYKNVINEAIRLNEEGEESWLAIETSGHAALKENYFLDDGAYLVAKLLIEMAKLNAKGIEITQLIQTLEQAEESEEFRFSITKENFVEYGKYVLSVLLKSVESIKDWQVVEPNYEGVRVRCTNPEENGWFLLRLSLHDPVMPLNIESNCKGGMQKIASRIKKLLSVYNGLDLSAFE